MSELNFEIDPDAGCDYECAIWEPHQHITVIDNTPVSELDKELERMQREIRREAYFAKHGHYPKTWVDHLFALSPPDTPLVSLYSTAAARVDPELELTYEIAHDAAWAFNYTHPEGAVAYEVLPPVKTVAIHEWTWEKAQEENPNFRMVFKDGIFMITTAEEAEE